MGIILSKWLIQLSPSVYRLVNNCAKFQSHMSMDFENIWGITKTLSRKRDIILLNCLLLSTGWGHDVEQVCKVPKPSYVNGLWKYLRYYKIFNVNSKLKKGQYSVKLLDTVTSSFLQVWVIMVNKCAKFQSHMSMDLLQKLKHKWLSWRFGDFNSSTYSYRLVKLNILK
jgi:hypothetical protein